VQGVGEGDERVGVRGQELHQFPGGFGVLGALGDADDVAADGAGAVQIRLVVGDGHRCGAVVHLVAVVLDERGAPLAVHDHGELAGLEGVLSGPFVAESGLEPGEVVGAVPIDQVLLPVEHGGESGVVGEVGGAVGLEPLGAEARGEVLGHRLVGAQERHEPGHVDLAVRTGLAEPLRHPRQLGHRLGRCVVTGLLQQVLVVVEGEGVGEQRHGAPLAAELGVGTDGGRDLLQVDVVPGDARPEVLEGSGGAPGADLLGVERQRGVRRVAPAHRLGDLVGVLGGHGLDRDVGVRRLELVQDGPDRLDLVGVLEGVPEGDGHRPLVVLGRFVAGSTGGTGSAEQGRQGDHRDSGQFHDHTLLTTL
jgi:hypothetical protein